MAHTGAALSDICEGEELGVAYSKLFAYNTNSLSFTKDNLLNSFVPISLPSLFFSHSSSH